MSGQKNIGIELLRIVLMFMIVFGHCCCHGVFANERNVLVAGTTTFFAVDAFAFISGYYSIRTSIARFLKFLSLGLFWTVVV